MNTLDKIKLIDLYLHGVDRDIRKDEGDFEKEAYYACKSEFGENVYYHTSLDALRPVIVKLYQGAYCKYISDVVKYQIDYICGIGDFAPIFDSVVECIKYLNEKKA